MLLKFRLLLKLWLKRLLLKWLLRPKLLLLFRLLLLKAAAQSPAVAQGTSADGVSQMAL